MIMDGKVDQYPEAAFNLVLGQLKKLLRKEKNIYLKLNNK